MLAERGDLNPAFKEFLFFLQKIVVITFIALVRAIWWINQD